MYRRKFFVLIALLTLILLGCKLTDQAATAPTDTPAPTATADATPTSAPTDTSAPTPELSNVQTTEAVTPEVQATPTQAAPQASPTPAGARETEQAAGMSALLQRLQSDGAIGATQGDYYRLNDFDESFAQISWYQWWKTGYSAENFVLAANTAWQSASDKANWPEAGCGIVFSLGDKDNHAVVYLGLDGFVRIGQMARGNYKLLASKKYGKVSIPDGDAKIALAVYNRRVHYYVNDKDVASANLSAINAPGDIALTLLSGTNKDFGTRCQMTQIDLMIFK